MPAIAARLVDPATTSRAACGVPDYAPDRSPPRHLSVAGCGSGRRSRHDVTRSTIRPCGNGVDVPSHVAPLRHRARLRMKLRRHADVDSLRRMTQPATNTKKPAAQKATTTKAPAKAAKPAAKATSPKASTTKATKAASPKKVTTADNDAVIVDHAATKAPSKGAAFAASTDATELIVKHDAAKAATDAFEAFVCELITQGVSPSHIANAIGLGNSSVRRIAMRHGLDVK